MGKLRLITHLSVLATSPSLLIYPQDAFRQTDFHMLEAHARVPKNFRKTQRYQLASYDDILKFIEDIESETSEYREKDLRRINRFLSYLASESALPNSDNAHELINDINDLLADDYAFLDQDENDHAFLPAIGGQEAEFLLCKSHLSKKWKKTKRFVKKHKKEIIIGAVIVVATATVVIAVVATSSVGAAAAAAGAAGAASSSKPNREEKSGSSQTEISDLSRFEDTRSVVEAANAAPTIKATIDEQIREYKEFLIEDQLAQHSHPSEEWNDLTFLEKAREVGAHFAHQAYQEVTELFSVLPQFCDEIKDLGSKLLPETLMPPNNELIGDPQVNFENLMAKAHNAIDTLFATNQGDLFTAETRANDPINNFAIGMIPLPSGIPKLFANTSNLIKAGNAIDRAGFTRVGRGLMKHGYREGSLFPKPFGSPSQINIQGENFLKEILNDSKRTVLKNNRGGIEIYSQSGRGAYFREDGTFRGFVEYGHK